jgi:hypothetical protein
VKADSRTRIHRLAALVLHREPPLAKGDLLRMDDLWIPETHAVTMTTDSRTRIGLGCPHTLIDYPPTRLVVIKSATVWSKPGLEANHPMNKDRIENTETESGSNGAQTIEGSSNDLFLLRIRNQS